MCENLDAARPACVVSPTSGIGGGGNIYRGTLRSHTLAKRLAADGGLLAFAGRNIYVSPDRGKAWPVQAGPDGLSPVVIRGYQGKFYLAETDSAAGTAWVAVSADSGRSRSRLGQAVPGTRSPWALALRPREIYTATDAGVFLWRQGGSAWELLNEGLPDRDVRDLVAGKDRLVAGLASGGVWELPLAPVGIRRASAAPHAGKALEGTGSYRDRAGSWRRIDGRHRELMRP